MNAFRSELEDIIKKHHGQLNYWQMLGILIDFTRDLFEKSSAEYAVKGGW